MRIYVAGPLGANNAPGFIKNISRMIKTAIELYKLGHYPYVPCLDILMGLIAGDWEYEDYFRLNQEWLKVADAMFVIDLSPGTNREIELAHSLNIPVYWKFSDIREEI